MPTTTAQVVPSTSDGRTGQPHVSSDTFDQAFTTFAGRYADQNESDYRAFADAIDRGDLEAEFED